MFAIGAPLGLLALLGLPAVVVFHWFRRRHHPVVMTGLFLYPPPPARAAAGRRRERLRLVTSLVAELLAVLAATWWLADVHLAADDRAPHEVIVLDDRLRLLARDADGTTAAQRLRIALDRHLADLPEGARATLVATGDPPRLLAGPSATPAEVRRALATWEPTAPWHDPAVAVGLARRLAAGGTVLIASDRRAGWPDDLGLIATGRAVASSGLADAAWMRRPTGDRLVLRTYGPLGRPLEVRAGERLLARGVSAATPITLDLVDAPATVTVALVGDDPLPVDDRVDLVRPEARTVRVRGTLPGLARVAAVLGWVEVVTDGPADLVIGGEAPAGAWRLTLAPATGGSAVLGPFLARAGHPLLQDLDAAGLWWTGAAPTAPGTPLVTAGDRVLLSEERRGGDRLLTLCGDPAAPGVAGHPWWPGFLANLIEARRAALPGINDPNVVVGRTVAVIMPGGGSLTDPAGATTALPVDAEGRVLVTPQRAGVHRLLGTTGPGPALSALALDARLGDLAAALTVTAPAPPAAAAVERRRGAAGHLLPLGLLAAALVVAWWAFRREQPGLAP